MYPIFKPNKKFVLRKANIYPSQHHLRVQLVVKQFKYARTQGALYSRTVLKSSTRKSTSYNIQDDRGKFSPMCIEA